LAVSVGLFLFLGGSQFILETYSEQYWYIYAISGLLIYQFHDKLTSSI
jgi:hypothetical protein